MQKKPLMQAAKAKAPEFKRPDITPFIPKGQEDAVQRVVAAGMRYLYSPDMKDEVMQAIQSDEPVGLKLGQSAAGLILLLDNQAEGGIALEAMFPAGVELMSEAAEMLVAAGQKVSEDDFADGFFALVAILGKKLGGSDEQIMSEMSKYAGGDEGEGEPMEEDPAAEAMPAGEGSMA